ncbi:MAG: ribbon-helix-helix domain-containing protein [Candidatus Acidiferrales bacterium]
MNITLSPDLERLIAEKVESGQYGSADEVIREGRKTPVTVRKLDEGIFSNWPVCHRTVVNLLSLQN